MTLRENFEQRTSLGYLAIIRIAIGYHFFTTGWAKVTKGFDEMSPQLLAGVAKDTVGWHHSFIVGWVIPNAFWFKYVVAYGELAIAISLLAGCLVRISSLFGAFHNFNILLAVATGAQIGLNRLFIVVQLVFVLSSAGRSLGVDGWLHRRFPRSRLF